MTNDKLTHHNDLRLSMGSQREGIKVQAKAKDPDDVELTPRSKRQISLFFGLGKTSK